MVKNYNNFSSNSNITSPNTNNRTTIGGSNGTSIYNNNNNKTRAKKKKNTKVSSFNNNNNNNGNTNNIKQFTNASYHNKYVASSPSLPQLQTPFNVMNNINNNAAVCSNNNSNSQNCTNIFTTANGVNTKNNSENLKHLGSTSGEFKFKISSNNGNSNNMTEIKQKLTSTSMLLSKSVQTVPISEIQLSNSFTYNTTNTNNIGKDLPFDLKNHSTLLFTPENLYSDTNTDGSTDSTTSSRRSSQISNVSSVFSVELPTNDVKRFYSKSVNNDKKETRGGKQEKYKKNEYYCGKKNNNILPMDLSNITFDTDVANNNSTTSIDLGQKNLSLNEQRIIKNLLDCLDTQQLLKMIYAAPAVVPSKYDHVDSNDYNQNKRDYTGWLETPSCCNLDRKI